MEFVPDLFLLSICEDYRLIENVRKRCSALFLSLLNIFLIVSRNIQLGNLFLYTKDVEFLQHRFSLPRINCTNCT